MAARSLLRLLLSGALAGAVPATPSLAVEASLYLEGIVIRFDTERWRVSSEAPFPADPGAEEKGVRLFVRCIAVEECAGEPQLWVRAVAIPEPDFSPNKFPLPRMDNTHWQYNVRPLWSDEPDEVRTFGGLQLSGSVRHSNCRARTPPAYRAAGDHDGVRYTFGSGWAFGCGGIEGVPREMFMELLSGIALVEGIKPEQ